MTAPLPSFLFRSACFLAALFLLIPESRTQEQDQEAPRRGGFGAGGFWKAEVEGGSFLVPHSAISSISRSTYLVDGAIRVTEVSVGTTGSVQGRFYVLEPITPQSPAGVGQSTIEDIKSRASEVGARLGLDDAETEVTKNYPTTTHAHTVEFRLANLQTLDKLLASLERSFISRRTETFRSSE